MHSWHTAFGNRVLDLELGNKENNYGKIFNRQEYLNPKWEWNHLMIAFPFL